MHDFDFVESLTMVECGRNYIANVNNFVEFASVAHGLVLLHMTIQICHALFMYLLHGMQCEIIFGRKT